MANYYFNVTYEKAKNALKTSNSILALEEYKRKSKFLKYSHSFLPNWASTPQEFWEKVELHERTNGRGYRRFNISLPNELPLSENLHLMRSFIDSTLENKFYYSMAIYIKNSFINEEDLNTYCILIFNEREIDEIERTPELFFKRYNPKEPNKGGARKNREFKTKEKLLELRLKVENLINYYYKKNGFNLKVSCKTLKVQKEKAELEGDFEKAEFLDRPPINLNSKFLLRKKDLTDKQKQELENYTNAIEIRNSKKK